MDIPADLVAAVAERRVIPFLGAGFSAAVGLPDWDQLLAKLASETEASLPYDELKRYTGGDYLQIAEYLYLKSDQRIGPLRHVIERGLPEDVDPSLSPAHVELVNLGAPQIYTTNYDDLIESTYRRLGLPVNVVALGKDVAVAGQQTTQVVKYHGDLRHESTLVLTESSYYKRLDFESAMDVKFRADLLGRSVLFMGYSFRDINIRLIWFKLNQMMEDIPQADRRQSYIVRLEPNPVLEELYDAVGLKTLVLDQPPPTDGRDRHLGPVRREAEEVTSLAAFLEQVASRAAGPTGAVPGSEDALFVTSTLVDRAERICDRVERREDDAGRYYAPQFWQREIGMVLSRRTPAPLQSRVDAVAQRALGLPVSVWPLAIQLLLIAQKKGPSPQLTMFAMRQLMRNVAYGTMRQRLLEETSIDWSVIWGSKLEPDAVTPLLKRFESEIQYNEGDSADDDIAYAADIAARIESGMLIDEAHTELREQARDLLDQAAEVYSSIKDLTPTSDAPPAVREVLGQIEERRKSLPPDDDLVFEDDD